MYDQITICRTEDYVKVFYTNKPYRDPVEIAAIDYGDSLETIAQEIYEICACLNAQVTTVNSRD